jgi:hypothetical protein
MAIVSSAGLPKACHASQRSRKNSSLSLLREPFGRPLGLPDWPGFQGINPRCLCFRTVESLSAASASGEHRDGIDAAGKPERSRDAVNRVLMSSVAYTRCPIARRTPTILPGPQAV